MALEGKIHCGYGPPGGRLRRSGNEPRCSWSEALLSLIVTGHDDRVAVINVAINPVSS
jgi:hypothetical protein